MKITSIIVILIAIKEVISCSFDDSDYVPLSFYTRNIDDNQCVKKCNNNWYLDQSKSFHCTNSIDSCDNLYQFVTSSNQCVSQCLTDEPYFISDGNDLAKCSEKCPHNHYAFESDFNCQRKPKICLEELTKKVKEEFSQMYSKNKGQIFYYEDITLQIYNTTQKGKEEAYNKSFQDKLSKINIDECEQKLREFYNISLAIPLIIVKLDIDLKNSTTNQVEYSIYSQEGEKIDLSPCNETPVEIFYPIVENENLNLNLAKNLSEKNIDIYNSSHPFFNDICFTFKSQYNTDVTLQDRQKEYFVNTSFCDEGCCYNGINLSNSYAGCKCKIKKEISFEKVFKVFSKDFPTSSKHKNVMVAKCYKKVFSVDIFRNNIGNYLTFFLFICQICCFLVYVCFGKEKIKRILFLFSLNYKFSPPFRKNKGKEKKVVCINLEKNEQIIFHTPINSECSLSPIQYSQIKSSVSKNLMRATPKYILSDKKETEITKNTSKYTSSTNEVNIKVYHNPSEEKKTLYDKYELNYINFEDALVYDKRNLSETFCTILALKHPLIYLFFIKDKYSIKAIYFSVFLTLTEISLSFNALFYNSSYISKQYHNKGSLNFIERLPKSIYSFVFIVFFGFLFNFLASSKKTLIEILFYSGDKKIQLLRDAIECMKVKIWIYYFIAFIFSLMVWYFVTVFCAVFQNSQTELGIGAIISICIGTITPILFSFFIFTIRIIGIKKKSEFFYSMSIYLM